MIENFGLLLFYLGHGAASILILEIERRRIEMFLIGCRIASCRLVLL